MYHAASQVVRLTLCFWINYLKPCSPPVWHKVHMWLMEAEQNFEAEEAKLNFKRAVEEVLGVFYIGLIS